jgi:hypothetical protein
VLEEKRYQRRVWTAEGDTLIGSFVVFLAG